MFTGWEDVTNKNSYIWFQSAWANVIGVKFSENVCQWSQKYE